MVTTVTVTVFVIVLMIFREVVEHGSGRRSNRCIAALEEIFAQ